jgi:hypothetical protein
MAQGRFMREMVEPSLVVRIDGKKVATNKYEKPGQYIDGQDIGVYWPNPANFYLPKDPEGPRIAQTWYEIQPGSHQLEIAAISGWWIEQRKRGQYYNIGFDVGPDGVYTVSCQWHNNPEFLTVFLGEGLKMTYDGRIAPSDA